MSERLNRPAHISEYLAHATKGEQWEELKRRDPKLAEVLKQHAKVFGKPAEIRITWKERKA